MRGSPLFRTLLLVAGLLLVGWGMLRFGKREAALPARSGEETVVAPSHRQGFAIKLSTPAERIELKSRDGATLFAGESTDPLVGMIALRDDDPAILLTIRWKQEAAAGATHFAKLTLEPPGKPSVVRYFEAPGDIEDVWELPVE